MLKEGNSGSAASEPPTGALCMKSVGFRKLSSHASKGDSINHISQRALQHRKRQHTHTHTDGERESEREMTKKERALGMSQQSEDETRGRRE